MFFSSTCMKKIQPHTNIWFKKEERFSCFSWYNYTRCFPFLPFKLNSTTGHFLAIICTQTKTSEIFLLCFKAIFISIFIWINLLPRMTLTSGIGHLENIHSLSSTDFSNYWPISLYNIKKPAFTNITTDFIRKVFSIGKLLSSEEANRSFLKF